MVWTEINRRQCVTDGEWAVLEPLIPPPSPIGCTRETDLRVVRLCVVREQIKEIEQQRLRKLEAAAAEEKGPHAIVRLIERVVGIGVETADMLVNEILSRHLRDSKGVARYAGLTGSPDESGNRRREKGLARGGAG